jgi:hypothetical protein
MRAKRNSSKTSKAQRQRVMVVAKTGCQATLFTSRCQELKPIGARLRKGISTAPHAIISRYDVTQLYPGVSAKERQRVIDLRFKVVDLLNLQARVSYLTFARGWNHCHTSPSVI